MYCPGDGQSCGMPMPGERSQSTVRRLGPEYGRGLRKRALAPLKMAELAPIPRARERTMTLVRARLLARVRRA